MSSSENKQPGETTKWYLRIDPSSVYGPVPAMKLREWAQQGRIAPGNEVSVDGTSWLSADQLPELEMVWNVALGDGTTFGPLNIKALRDLIEDQTITLDSALSNVETGETFSVGEMREAIYAEERTEQVAAAIAEHHRENVETFRRLQTKLSEALDRLNTARTNLNEEREHHTATRGELATTAEALATTKAELSRLRDQLEEERRQTKATRDASEGTLAELRNELARKTDELARANEQRETLGTQLDATKARLAELEQQLEQAGRSADEQARALRERIDNAERELADARKTLETEQLAHADARAERDSLRNELARTGELREQDDTQLRELREELDSLRRNLTQTQEEGRNASDALAAERGKTAGLQAQLRQITEERDESRQRQLQAEQALVETRNESDTALEESLQREQDLTRKLVKTQQEAAETARSLTDVQQQLNEAMAVSTSVKTLEKQLDQERKRNDDLSRTKARLEEELLAIKDNFESELEHNRGRLEQLVTALDSPAGREIVIPEIVPDDGDVMPEPPKQTSSVLADLEAQAQRELRAWQNARRGNRRR